MLPKYIIRADIVPANPRGLEGMDYIGFRSSRQDLHS